ncbi:MAG: BON domain-containing protein [Kiritimatiellae bacterium]|nr:BON domain-containing protein [Kiritimatiellia bacterium]
MNRWISGVWLGSAALMLSVMAGCATGNIQPTAGTDDDAIVVAVRERLAADPITQRYSIGVSSVRGFVTLSGAVPIEARARALSIARGTEGVRAVEDRMSDRPWSSTLTPTRN